LTSLGPDEQFLLLITEQAKYSRDTLAGASLSVSVFRTTLSQVLLCYPKAKVKVNHARWGLIRFPSASGKRMPKI